MKRTTPMLASLLVLAGCMPAVQSFKQYNAPPRLVTVSPAPISGLYVPSEFEVAYDANRATVAPTAKERARLISGDPYTAKWAANVAQYMPIYIGAMSTAMNRECHATSFVARPEWFALDLTYSCP